MASLLYVYGILQALQNANNFKQLLPGHYTRRDITILKVRQWVINSIIKVKNVTKRFTFVPYPCIFLIVCRK